jgi:branched-chain amino acid transport system substrate-binding protein
MVRGTRRVVALAAVGCLFAAAGCGSSDDSGGGGGSSTGDAGSSGGQTIKVGQIVTEGGVVSFPVTARGAVKAVFDEVNAAGGVNGNKIDVTTINDAVNPQNTTAATRKLIGDGVVAFVGGDSPYDCAVNNPLYAQAKVYSVGLGIAGACFGTPFYASVGNSPATTNAVLGKWASENIGPKICIIGVNYPGFAPQFVGANKLLAGMGLKPTYQNTTISQTANPSSTVLAADRAGCQSAVTNLTPTQTVQALQTVKRQGLKLKLMGASGLYSDLVLKGLGVGGEGFLLSAQMEPWHETTSRNQAYVDLMKKNNVGLDEFSTAGYISAMAFVEALKSIEGEVTRESVGAALKKLQYTTTMLAEPFSFNAPAGPQGGNAPNVSTKVLQIKGGKFETISDWIGIPDNLRKDTVDFR